MKLSNCILAAFAGALATAKAGAVALPGWVERAPASTGASAAPTTNGSRLAFPSFTPADPIEQIASRILGFFANALVDAVPVPVIAAAIPKMSLEENMDFVFTPLPGKNEVPEFAANLTHSAPGTVRWFTEAPGRTPSDPVVFFVHGGAYFVGMLPYYATLLESLYKAVGNERLSILWLDYSLTPGHAYPAQLQQAIEAYNALAQSSNNIIAVGDSAGAHLTLQMSRTLQHVPTPAITSPIARKPECLALISPWVNLYPAAPAGGTWASNAGSDIFNAHAVRQAGLMYIPTRAQLIQPQYNPYIDAGTDWSAVLPSAEHTLVTAGGLEVLRGDIETFAHLAGLDHRLLIDTNNGHDHIIFQQTSSPTFDPLVDLVRTCA